MPILADIKALALPAGANLDHSSDSDQEDEDDEQLQEMASLLDMGREVKPLENPRKFPELTGNRTLYGRHGILVTGVRVDGNTARSWTAAREIVLDITFHDKKTNRQRKKTYRKCPRLWNKYAEYRDLLHADYDYEAEYGRPLEFCTEEEVQVLWDA